MSATTNLKITVKDKAEMLVFYDFSVEHWLHICAFNPIKMTFSMVRLRITKTRNCISREGVFTMVFKLVQSVEKRWKRLHGLAALIADIVEGVEFENGVKQAEKGGRSIA